MNTNKKGVTLDSSSATGRKLLDRLLADADVLVDNRPPAQAKELGLDYQSLSAGNPQLVVTSITPFGQTALPEHQAVAHENAWPHLQKPFRLTAAL